MSVFSVFSVLSVSAIITHPPLVIETVINGEKRLKKKKKWSKMFKNYFFKSVKNGQKQVLKNVVIINNY